MGTTQDLQNKLKEILGSDNVYFQPPSNKRMQYPCFVVSLGSASQSTANNYTYLYTDRYVVTYISYDPDDDMRKRMGREFQMCKFDNHLVSDNLQHYVFSLYW